MIGQTISHYKITEKLGEGGMGVVYKAEDTKLQRPVALKFLRSEATENADAKARFLREARAAAALDHENVCTVYEIDEADGQTFLSMAYLEGETVREKTKARPLKIEEALDIAIQTGLGLQAAHEKEIVHRDIKSANLIVTPRGQVKIMDFGLAQLAEQSRLTKTAMILGTPAYMSPEQARREPTDRRTDIWSLGVVIYEMITGKLPFEGEREDAVAYAVVHQEPEPITALRVGVPVDLDRVVAKAMAKDRNERYQHIDEMLVDLRNLGKGGEIVTSARPPAKARRAGAAAGTTTRPGVPLPGATETAARSRQRRLVWILAVVAAFVVVGMATRFFRATEPQAPLRAVPLTSYEGTEQDATFSPDGNQVAFSWDGAKRDNYDIYVKVIGAESPLRLTSDPAPDRFPAWSPDGRQIAFTRLSSEMETVYLISPLGGPERGVAEMLPRTWWAGGVLGGLEWSPDGRSLFLSARDSVDDLFGIHRLSIDTGVMTRFTSPPADVWPGDSDAAVAPDGHSLAFVRTTAAKSEILLAPVDGGAPEQLIAVDGFLLGLAWTPSGEEIVVSRGHIFNQTLWRVPTLGGAPRQLPGLGENAYFPVISPARGRLVYERWLANVNIYRYDLPGSPQQAGAPQKLIATTQVDFQPQISPDGRRIAFVSARSGHDEIWVCDRDGSNAVQLTAYEGTGNPAVPQWSRDGSLIAFDCSVSGNFDVFVINSEGGSPRQLTTYDGEDSRPTWSQDGLWIYFGSIRTGTFQVWRMPAEGGEPVQVTKNGGYNPVESPDGKFVYYAQQRYEPGLWRVPVSGGEEVCVLPSLQRASQRKWDVVDEGVYFLELEDAPSRQSNWSLKFFRFDTGRVARVTELERPPEPWLPFDVSPDGTWFLLAETEQGGSDLMLVENFR